MLAFTPENTPVIVRARGVEVRKHNAGGMAVAFVRADKGIDLRPILKGLPQNLCQCPHWGVVLKGKLRMHSEDAAYDYGAGEAFYWAPGHAPEMLEDTEYVDFSPINEFEPVIQHIIGRIS
jgi:hypothetical protein